MKRGRDINTLRPNRSETVSVEIPLSLWCNGVLKLTKTLL